MRKDQSIIESYGPDLTLVGFWLLLVSIPVALIITNLVRIGPLPGTLQMLALTAIMPAIVIVFAFRFRANFTDEAFSYRRWGTTFSIPYADIVYLEVTNRTRISKDVVGAFVVTRDGRRYPFWPKLFPRAAITKFMKLGPVQG